jgi:hypothetical protein
MISDNKREREIVSPHTTSTNHQPKQSERGSGINQSIKRKEWRRRKDQKAKVQKFFPLLLLLLLQT